MKVFNTLLFPFAILFRMATGIRNHLYNIGHKRSTQFQVPVICVGNLNIGGSGKTPAIEYLVRLLKDKYQVATLSRGYGRRTRGLRIATESDNATTLGDEPFQFFKNFGKDVKVAVGEDRAFAIPNILHDHPDIKVVLLDDAFQHRRVKPHLSILLTTFDKPFYRDYLLPMGRLRESRREASRADIIVVTKCESEFSVDIEQQIEQEVHRFAPGKPVFFSEVKYGAVTPFWETERTLPTKVLVVSGIASAKQFNDYVKNNFEVVKNFQFRDHHNFTEKDITIITSWLDQHPDASLLTTEKDMVRLVDPKFGKLKGYRCFYLPIEMQIKKNGSEFDAQVVNTVEKVLASAFPVSD